VAEAQGLLLNRRTYVRSLIAGSVAGGSEESLKAYAFGRWAWAHPDSIAKAAIGALVAEGNSLATEFLSAVRERSVLGRLNFRRVPFNVRMLAMTEGARGYWVGQGRPVPLSKPTLDGSTLLPLRLNAILCVTKEGLRDTSNLAEKGLTVDLERAIAGTIDEAFLNPNNSGVPDESPASITRDATTINSAGSSFDNLRTDLSAMISAYQGDIQTAAWIMAPRTAVQISLLGGPSAMIDLSVSGGTLVGLPCVTSAALGIDSNGPSIALVDTQAIAYALDNLEIETSDETSLLMSDDPESIPGELVSTWQTNTQAWKSTALANWEIQRTGAVVLLTGADYA
jgi:HK97 family phage major capsid protein